MHPMEGKTLACESNWKKRIVREAIEIKEKDPYMNRDALEAIGNWQDASSAAQARRLLASVRNLEFLVSLHVAADIGGVVRPLSIQLQARNQDAVQAIGLVHTAQQSLENRREKAEEAFKTLFDHVQETAMRHDIDVKQPKRLVKRQRHRENYQTDSAEEFFRVSIFVPMLDCTIQELKARFSDHTKRAMRISLLVPRQLQQAGSGTVDPGRLREVCERYGNAGVLDYTAASLRLETDRWIRLWKDSEEEDAPSTVLQSIARCPREHFPTIWRLFEIAAVLPVTSAEAERSFSTVRQLKSYLRSTMGEERLTALALMQIHPELVPSPAAILDAYHRNRTGGCD
ncbi:zinc finger MYM-type protein 1-like [Amphibalanus amphitrite]|uniref:zinc finger MYM-type protein 1-like n=1 Tax=Amphibalanus amphitrite TaxID=1232801 RepID=UPI001C9243C8|nr:zinc finger MYM-type protein 1-like [Amphibalanus amphitrite]